MTGSFCYAVQQSASCTVYNALNVSLRCRRCKQVFGKWCDTAVGCPPTWREVKCTDNFSLPMPLCSRLRPDVRDRQTSDRHQTSDIRRQTASSLNALAY